METYHHVIPKTIRDNFTHFWWKDLEKIQVKVDRETHDLIEAMNSPLVYLLENGYPRDKEDYKKFISHIAVVTAPYNDEELIEHRVINLTCTHCGTETPINPRTHKVKYCRHCGEPIYNIHKHGGKEE